MVLDSLNDAQDRIARLAQQKLSTLSIQLSTLQETIPRLFSVVKTRQESRLDALYHRIVANTQQKTVASQAEIRNIEQRLPMLLERKLTAEHHRMEILEEKVHALDPQLLLRRGYSITLHNGKAVRDPKVLQKGDEIETRLNKGAILSIVK